MKIYLDKDRVGYLPTSLKDYSVLKTFPGLIKIEESYYSSSKGPVIRNLIKRLSKKGVELQVSKEVVDIANNKDLLPLPDWFTFHTPPLKHQELALRFLYTNRGGGLLLDPGLGKTKVICDYIFLSRMRRALVICPKPLMFVWREEIGTHRPELTFHVFESTNWEIEYEQAKDKQVWIINYAKASILEDFLVNQRFDGLFVDEGLVKDTSSVQTNAITTLARQTPLRSIMSGTLVNNSEGDIYAPVRILEPSLVGMSYIKFRDEYLQTWAPDKNREHMKVVCGAKDPELLKSILHSCSIVMRKEQWLNLPKKNFHYVDVELPTEVMEQYYRLMRNYILSVDGCTIEADNPLSLMAKLSQFGSGFLYLEKENEVELDLFLNAKKKKSKKNRKTHFFDQQPKIDALRDLLRTELRDKKFVLWYTMDAERVLIESLLKESNKSFLTIAGGDKNISDKVRQFNTDPNTQILLCQARTLNYGVTLLGKQEDEDIEANLTSLSTAIYTEVFYSLTYSLEVFLQQQDRIHRIGQEKECHYWILVSNTPTEKRLVKALSDKQCIREMMLEDWLSESLQEMSAYLN